MTLLTTTPMLSSFAGPALAAAGSPAPAYAPSVLEAAKNYIKSEAAAQSEELLGYLKHLNGHFSDNHVFLHIGSSSIVGIPTVLAGIQSGVIKNLAMVHNTLNGRNIQALVVQQAIKDFAEEHGVRVMDLDTNAIHVTGDRSFKPLNPKILKAVADLAGTVDPNQISVSLIESIAMGGPGIAAHREPVSLAHLSKDGTLGRVYVGQINQTTFKKNLANMGLNPDYWREGLARLGWFKPESVGFSYTWWNHDALTYGALSAAKRQLELLADRWLGIHGVELGTHLIIGQGVTISPALAAIMQGPLMGVGVMVALEEQGDVLSTADQGILNWLGALDQNFTHPWMKRNRAQLSFHEREQAVFPAVMEKIERVDAHVPKIAKLPASETDRILRRPDVMGLPEGWQRILAPLRLLDVPTVTPTDTAERIPEISTQPTQAVEAMAGVRAVLEFFRKMLETTDVRVSWDGDELVVDYRFEPEQLDEYGDVTNNPHAIKAGYAPLAQFFVQSQPAIFEALKPHLREAPRYTIIHRDESTTFTERLKLDGSAYQLHLSVESRGTPDKREVKLQGKHYDASGKLIATEHTFLKVGVDMELNLGVVKPIKEASIEELGTEVPELGFEITNEMVRNYRRVSGDQNIVHGLDRPKDEEDETKDQAYYDVVGDEAARALGLPGKILHGMYEHNVVEAALGDVFSGTVKVDFGYIGQVGDRVRVFRLAKDDGTVEVTLLNQNNYKLVQATHTPLAAE